MEGAGAGEATLRWEFPPPPPYYKEDDASSREPPPIPQGDETYSMFGGQYSAAVKYPDMLAEEADKKLYPVDPSTDLQAELKRFVALLVAFSASLPL